jgi:hypothetical protein
MKHPGKLTIRMEEHQINAFSFAINVEVYDLLAESLCAHTECCWRLCVFNYTMQRFDYIMALGENMNENRNIPNYKKNNGFIC